jgi:hypothetical protein
VSPQRRNVDGDIPQPTQSTITPGPAGGAEPGSTKRTAALLCAVALLWLATRLYFGAVFDARFYMVEALNALDPSRFADDLYFKFGSQGSFSFFIKLYQPLLRAFGVGTTGIILTVCGQLLWLFGLFRLARALVGDRTAWLSIAVVIGLPQIYAGGFGYGENYVTARLFAEAFVMLGLASLSSRPLWAVILLGVSLAIHPLMALPGIAVAFVYLALGRPIWWAVMAAGLGAAATLGLAGVQPFSNLFRTIDPEWFAIINLRAPHCLLFNWSAGSFREIAAVVAWAIAALAVAGPSHRRFLAAAFLVGLGGLVCAFLGGDIAHNVLVVEIQSWRSMWVLQIVSHIYAPVVFASLLARTSLDNFRWTTLLSMGLILSSSATRLLRHPAAAEFTILSLTLIIAALAVMAVHLLLADRRIASISALVGFLLIPVALSQWDARSPWIRYVESPEPPPKELASLLPANASIYWESGLEMLWLRMRHASYFSCDQGTGVMFYRQTAMAFKHRSESFWPLRTGDFTQLDTCAGFDKKPKPERNRAGLQKLCIREPELDYLVLTRPLDEFTPVGTWKSPVLFQDIQSTTDGYFARVANSFYIYSCASVR